MWCPFSLPCLFPVGRHHLHLHQQTTYAMQIIEKPFECNVMQGISSRGQCGQHTIEPVKHNQVCQTCCMCARDGHCVLHVHICMCTQNRNTWHVLCCPPPTATLPHQNTRKHASKIHKVAGPPRVNLRSNSKDAMVLLTWHVVMQWCCPRDDT